MTTSSGLRALGSVLFLSLAFPAVAHSQEPVPALTMDQLIGMCPGELEALYRASPAAPRLGGYYLGKSLRRPWLTGILWKGKYFDGAGGTIQNRWLCGIKAVQAMVYCGDSWLDGKGSLIMDYRDSSWIWRNVRDELREVAPGLFLGIMYRERKDGPKLVRFFALHAVH